MYFAKEVLASSSTLKQKWEDEVRKSVAKVADQKPALVNCIRPRDQTSLRSR